MEKNLPYFAIVIILIYALYNAYFKDNKVEKVVKNQKYIEHVKVHKIKHYKEELNKVLSNQYLKKYITDVINHGSDQFEFSGGIMEGGFVSEQDAPKIACYVLELSGKKCGSSYSNDAAMFYTSVCGGCHGDDGKGLGGTYPDLTKDKLLGIEKREDYLKTMLTHSH